MKINKNSLLTVLGISIIYVLILAMPIDVFLKNMCLTTFQVDSLSEFVKNLLIVFIAVFAIKKFKVFELSGLNLQFKWLYKYLAIIPVYLLVIGTLQLLKLDFSSKNSIDIFLLFLSTMSIGFSEEFVFRGLMSPILMKKHVNEKKGILLSILIPAIIFGLLHLLNFKVANLSSEISQLLYAIYFGVFFGAILYRTNRLIPLAIMHGLIDFVFGFDSLFETDLVPTETINSLSEIISAIASSVLVLPLFIMGLLTIKKIKKEDVLEKITLSNKN